MVTPWFGLLFHLTHVSNLVAIVAEGLQPDSRMNDTDRYTDIGHSHIKERRRSKVVPVDPGGHVSDYVPFYFAARSPMLYAIQGGSVSSFEGSQQDLVYLVADPQRLSELGSQLVFTDRNASLALADFETDLGKLTELVDVELMNETYWYDTAQDPDRKERRQAEMLVHRVVPWTAIHGIGVYDEARLEQVVGILTSVGSDTQVAVRRNWYY